MAEWYFARLHHCGKHFAGGTITHPIMSSMMENLKVKSAKSARHQCWSKKAQVADAIYLALKVCANHGTDLNLKMDATASKPGQSKKKCTLQSAWVGWMGFNHLPTAMSLS